MTNKENSLAQSESSAIINLFDSCDHNHNSSYSTTEHSALSSTTFSLGGSLYCIHCGAKAKLIQVGDINDYEDAGYRCTCVDAMNEMAQLLAVSMGDFNHSVISFKKSQQVPTDILSKIVSKRRLDMHDFTHHANGKIEHGLADSCDFLHENKYEIKFNLHDDWHKNDPLVLFIKLTTEHFELFCQETKKYHQETETELDKILTESLFKRKGESNE